MGGSTIEIRRYLDSIESLRSINTGELKLSSNIQRGLDGTIERKISDLCRCIEGSLITSDVKEKTTLLERMLGVRDKLGGSNEVLEDFDKAVLLWMDKI